MSFFATADCVFALWSFASLAADARVPVSAVPSVGGVALAINLESEAEVDRVLGEAVAAGAELRRPAARADWGGYNGYFADLDGHLWEIAYNPGFPLDQRGSVVLPE